MRVALLSNVNLDLVSQALSSKHLMYPNEGYGQWVQEAIAPSESLGSFHPEVIVLILDGFSLIEGIEDTVEAERELQTVAGYCQRLAESYPSAYVLVSSIDIAPRRILEADRVRPEHNLVCLWERSLDELMLQTPNLHLFDLRTLIEEVGRSAFYSDKMWYMASVPYSMKAVSVLAEAIDARIQRMRTARKKVLVLDLDNTLWGGVLAEDGLDGIQLSRSLLGATYRDAQLRIKELKRLGILLAIVSKNDEAEVRRVLLEHPQMVLRADDFVAIVANWEPKAENIARLADTLNLGLDSFVFLDDNPVEQEAVRRALPEVTVVDFPRDVSRLPELVRRLASDLFFTTRVTDEDYARTQQYQQEVRRREALNAAVSIDDYLISLQISVVLEEMRDQQIQRVAQLTQKTNQFNLVTARFTPEELFAYRSKPGNRVFVASVSDRFGDSGLVFVMMVSTDSDVASIDNLLMSCRVMGRHIEDAVVDAVEGLLRQAGVRRMVARYVPTTRNKPVAELMDRLDYQLIDVDRDGVKIYHRLLECDTKMRKVLFEAVWRS